MYLTEQEAWCDGRKHSEGEQGKPILTRDHGDLPVKEEEEAWLNGASGESPAGNPWETVRETLSGPEGGNQERMVLWNLEQIFQDEAINISIAAKILSLYRAEESPLCPPGSH